MQNKLKGVNLRTLFNKYGIVFMLLVLVAVMTIMIPGFLSWSNITGIFTMGSIYGIMALGVCFVIISGGTDLSAGSMVALIAVVSSACGQQAGAMNKIFPFMPELGIWAPLLVAVVFGALCGAVNGVLVAKLKLFPFIATLGTYTIARGFALVITKGKPVTQLISPFSTVGGNLFGFFPTPILIFIICIILSSILLNRTKFGCNTFAVGGNPSAARITGINIDKTLIMIYAFAGIMYGVAAFVYAGRVLSVNPGAAKNYELTAISSAVIGGCNPAGGSGTIWGVVVGTLIVSTIRYSLTLLGVDAYWQQIAEGAIIVIAVIIAMNRKNKTG